MSDHHPSEPEKLDLASLDIAAQRRDELLRLFPEVQTEGGKIDFDRLKSALGEIVDAGRERYGMTWPGKAECMRTIQAPSMGTLLPIREESVDWDATENVIIEGDNLEVLKLLQKSYLGKVKMIYIDPPYNTGKDFIYPDNFTESLQTYLEYTRQVDSDGRRYGPNLDTDGRFHSKWLNMMYPRIFLAKNLLREDGVLFMTIDDTELANASRILTDLFGEENILPMIIWHKKRGKDNSATHVSKVHDYILVAARNATALKLNRLELDEGTKQAYRNPDNDPRGVYRVLGLWARGNQGGSRYEFTTKSGQHFSEREWLVGIDKMRVYDEEQKLIINGDKVYRKMFLTENEGAVVDSIWTDASNNANAADELKALFDGASPFDTPKPVPLIRKMIQLATNKDDLVLDFFAGSGTTGHAVMEQSAEDGIPRKFLMIQLPEETEGAAFETISRVTVERVRRASAKIRRAITEQLELISKPDLGFRLYQLGSSNFIPWDGTASNDADQLVQQLQLGIEHTRDDRSPEDLLHEILLKSWGEPALSLKVEEEVIEGSRVFSIADGAFLICLEEKVSLDLIRALAARKPDRVVMRESAFAGNDQLKTNAVQTFKTQGVTSFKVV